MARAARGGYDTDLIEEQWTLVEPFVRAEYSGLGPYHRVSRRAVVDAILYQKRTGCQWWLLPRDFLNWHTVRHYYDTWRADGTWEALNALARAGGRGADPGYPQGVADRGQPVGADHRDGRRGRDRWGEEGEGPEAAAGGGQHPCAGTRPALAGAGPRGERGRLRGGWLLLEGCVGLSGCSRGR